MNTNLLYIPLRQSRPIDLGQELSEIINHDFLQPSTTFEPDLNLVSNLRHLITTKFKNEQITKQHQEWLVQYLKYLQAIKRKFPNDVIEFGWYGLIPYGSPFKLRSLKFEELNIWYQLASVYSQLGCQESRQSDVGLKNACSYFQLSCGCFQMILQNLIDIPDLSRETIECLKYIMLAQAQETIWQKALSNMNHSVISKLSYQTSEYYSQALKLTNDDIKIEWINHLTVKKFHFKAASLLRRAIISQDCFKYGEQVAYLELANKSLELASKYTSYVNQLVLDDFQGLFQTIKQSLTNAHRDNDLIYHKIVPSEQELPSLVGVSMVKPIQPVITTSDIFNNLVPYIIIHVGQAFKERQDVFIQEQFHIPIQQLNTFVRKNISDRGLPASIDSITQSENIPDSIVHHSQEINIQLIVDSLSEIGELRTNCIQIVNECKSRIEGTSNFESLQARIDNMKRYLDRAKLGDDIVQEKYVDIKPYLDIYSQGYSGLISYIPNSKFVKLDDNLLTIISDLRSLLADIDKVITNRNQTLNDIDIRARENNIVPKLIEHYNTHSGELTEYSFEPIYDEHIKIFAQDLRYLENQKREQIELDLKLDDLTKKFQQACTVTATPRQESLQALETAYVKYLEVITNLNEGKKFYTDFIIKSNVVLKECEEHLYKQRIESRDLEQQQRQPQQSTTVEVVSPKTTKPIYNPNLN
ncbi:pH-response regulator protein [Spathaspora sp. JA1]|nr:pH-response regulator protein [Spathaspora sp. JA1]